MSSTTGISPHTLSLLPRTGDIIQLSLTCKC